MQPDLITTTLDPSLVRGAAELERTATGWLPHRLPAWARERNVDGQLAMAQGQPSGVRVGFRTTATVVEVDVLATKVAYVGAPTRPDGVHDLLVDGRLVGQATSSGGTVLTVDMSTGGVAVEPGSLSTLRYADLPAGEKDIELWLSFRETTELVALRTDAPVRPLPERGRRVWVHHGSSISQGSDAASATATWPALAALASGVDLVNLGFGGSAVLDPLVARTIRDAPADVISVKIGINLVNLDVMRLRAFGPAVHGFLDTIRDGHPDTPLLVVSPVLCPIHETTPGPSRPDLSQMSEGVIRFEAAGDAADPTRLTLERIRDELTRIVQQRSADDPHLHHLDGRALYGVADVADLPLPDDLHPDAATHRLIGERFARAVFGAGGAFA